MPAASIEARLRAALSSRDMVAIAALRSAMSAIANAEAIASAPAGRAPPSSEHIAGAVAGLGAAEALRRQLTQADIMAIASAEITDRLSAAEQYERLGRSDQSARLRREAAVLSDLLTAER